MPQELIGNGGCLCGAVRIDAKSVAPHVGACHCDMCRRWGGGPLMAVEAGTDVTITGEAHVTVYGSSEWAERGFCNRCGAHLFYRLKESRQYFLPVGLLDDESGFTFASQIFIDYKPAYYSFANDTENLTGAEVFARYAPPEQ